MTANELLAIARKARPHIEYAVHKNGSAIAAYDREQGRFVVVAALSLSGHWYSNPMEVLVDGERWYADSDFVAEYVEPVQPIRNPFEVVAVIGGGA